MDLSWIWGHARTAFHHASSTLPIPLKSTAADKPTTLAAFCASVTPPCTLNPLLFNGHFQTFYTVVKSQAVPVHYRRHVFESSDKLYPGSFAVDFATRVEPENVEEDKTLHPRTTYYTDQEWQKIGSQDDTPMLVALHGLSGGSHELYLRHVVAPLVNGSDIGHGKAQKWEACVVNGRGCANSEITTSMMFNARATWDVRQVVKWLRETFPNRPLFAIGFSLGGNILVNYLGEEGARCEFKAAVVLSNPWNLEVGSMALQRTWIGKEVYSKVMADGLKRLFEEHVDMLSQNPALDVEKVRQTRYLHEFDREHQARIFGYPTEGAYYRDASSTEPLMAVRIPLFGIHAEDDPVAPREALPFEEIKQTPYAVLCTTSLGGHLSWFEMGGGRWFVKPAVNFLRKFAEDVDLDSLSNQSRPVDDATLQPDFRGRIFDPVRRKLHIQLSNSQ